jgi:hypothetical protein
VEDATLYDGRDTGVGGTHAMFIVRGDPRTYNLPAAPEAPAIHLEDGWRSAAIAAGAMVLLTALAFLDGRSNSRRGIRHTLIRERVDRETKLNELW